MVIKGRSGVGKTTLLHVLAGLQCAHAGQLHWFGQEVRPHRITATTQQRGKNMAFVYQDFQLIQGLTALENVMLPLTLHACSEVESTARKWLARLELTERMHHLPAHLSGGEQQRVGLARALALSPKIIFADEPSGQLDDQTSAVLIAQLDKLRKAHPTTWIVCTHDDRLLPLATQQWQLQNGKLDAMDRR